MDCSLHSLSLSRFNHNQTIHVLDASKAVTVVSTLLDKEVSAAYCEDISEEYEEIREDYLDSLADRKYKTLEQVCCHLLVPFEPPIVVLSSTRTHMDVRTPCGPVCMFACAHWMGDRERK
jgi:hypothetical protein